MSVRTATKWFGVCLYYNEPWEDFLVQAVKPYVDIVIQTGVAECYYYERCWERGPHIRLWFKVNQHVFETILKPNLKEHFKHFFDSRPSFLVEPTYPHKYPEKFKWYPNNSLQYLDEEPDLKKLFSPLGFIILQKQLQASSDMVLQSIKNQSNRWTHDDALSNAVKLHLSFAFTIGLSLDESRLFYQMLFENWKPDSIKARKKDDVTHPTSSLQEDNIKSFEKVYALQKEHLIPFTNALLESLRSTFVKGNDTYANWLRINRDVFFELKLAEEAGKLLNSFQYSKTKAASEEVQQKILWKIYADLVQQTNNRLGIHNKDEGYLFYALSQSLKVANPVYPTVRVSI